MSTPRIPDFNTLWQTSDDETATEWLRLADSFTGGLFLEPGEHNQDPAQVVFLLYLLNWSIQRKCNFLVFDEHRDGLSEALERWAAPLGGETSPQYAFWRLQGHPFWRLMSWQECCDACELPHRQRDELPPDTAVGVLDEQAWLALMSDQLLHHNVLTYMILSYWPREHHQVATYFDVPDIQTALGAPRPFVINATTSRDATPRRKPSPSLEQPAPKLVRNRTYATDELVQKLNLLTSPQQSPTATVEPGTTALLISDASWRIERPSANTSHDEVHWSFSNRHYDDWLVLAEISDADRVLVFTKEPGGDAYRCRGHYELVSLEQRKWSFIRRIHDVILRSVALGGSYV